MIPPLDRLIGAPGGALLVALLAEASGLVDVPGWAFALAAGLLAASAGVAAVIVLVRRRRRPERRESDGRRRRDKVLNIVLAILVLSVVSNAVVGYVAIDTANEVRDKELIDSRVARESSYRICERGERVKADQHLQHPVGSRERRVDERRLPLFGCRSNLAGRAATRMTRRQMRRYVHRFATGKLNPIPSVTPTRPGGG